MRPAMARNRWLITTVVVGWAVLLLGLALWSSQTGPATIREQSELATGRQAMDRAVEVLREQAGPDTVAEVGPYQVSTGCRLTVARRGTEVERVVVLSVPPGEEPQVLTRLAEQVPAGWEARYFPNSGRLTADAGDFVRVVGEPTEPGEIRFTVSTGCRPGTDPTLPG